MFQILNSIALVIGYLTIYSYFIDIPAKVSTGDYEVKWQCKIEGKDNGVE